MEKEIKSVNAVSVFKFSLVLSLIIFAIIEVITLLITLFTEPSALLGWLGGLLAGIAACVLISAIHALGALIYNLVAGKFGGIKIGLE